VRRQQLCRLLHSDTCKWHWHYFTTKYAMTFLAARGRKTIIGDHCGVGKQSMAYP